jgi:tetratricopeptide (TPR) repeat protein
LHIAAAYNYIGDLRRMDDELAEALYYYEQAVRVAGRSNISAGVAIFLVNAGHTAYDLGQYAKACEYLEDALSLGEQFGEYQGYWCLRSYCTLHCILALLAVRDRCLHKGRSYLEKADEFLRKYHDLYQVGLTLRTKLEVCIQMQQDSQVKEVFADYLSLSVDEYYQQGKEFFRKKGNKCDQVILDKVYLELSKV